MAGEFPNGQPLRIDEFAVIREVATSALSHVFKAVDTQSGTIRIVKQLRAEKQGDTALFRHEPTLLATFEMTHPNIVRFFGYRGHENAFVLEYVWGISLDTLLRHGYRPAPRLTAFIGAEICRALAILHAHDIVHLDLKPSNVMLGFDGGVKLLDFGVAKAPVFSDQRVLGGTLSYMAPEHIEAYRNRLGLESIGPGADYFSLGVVLYELLTGDKPFERDNRNRRPAMLHAVDPGIPTELSELVDRMLDFDPERRRLSSAETLGVFGAVLGTERYDEQAIQGYRARVERVLVTQYGQTAVAELLENIEALRRYQKIPQARHLAERARRIEPDNPRVREACEKLSGAPDIPSPQELAGPAPSAPQRPRPAGKGGARPARESAPVQVGGRRSMRLVWILLAVVGVLCVGAAGVTAYVWVIFGRVADFEVRVLDPERQPVAGAQVVLTPGKGDPESRETGERGDVLFFQVWPGEAHLEVRAAGFRPMGEFITLPAPGNVRECVLERVSGGELHAEVRLAGAGGPPRLADWVTINGVRYDPGPDGRFVVPSRAGRWDFKFERDGYEPVTEPDVDIADGPPRQVSVVLLPTGVVNQPPAVELRSAEREEVPFSTEYHEVSGTASDPDGNLRGVQYRTGGEWQVASGSAVTGVYEWKVRVRLEAAESRVEVRAVDDLGACSEPRSLTIVRAERVNRPPTVMVSTSSGVETTQDRLAVSGVAVDPDGNLARVRFRVNAGSWADASGQGQWEFDAPLRTGENAIEVLAEDTDGAVSETASLRVVRREAATPPSVRISEPKDGAEEPSESVRVRGTASADSGGIAQVSYRVNGGSEQVASGSGEWSFNARLREGENTIEVWAYGDNKVKSEVARVRVTRRASKPSEPPVEKPPSTSASGSLSVDPQRVTLSGPGASGSIRVTLGGQAAAQSAIVASIQGSYGWMFNVSTGAGSVRVEAKDNAEHGEYVLRVSAGGQSADIAVRVGGTGGGTSPPASGGTGFRYVCPSFSLPGEYKEGARLSISPENRIAGAHYRWSVNGSVVLEGVGKDTLVHTLTNLGSTRVTMQILQDGRVVCEHTDETRVVAYPPVRQTLSTSQHMTFTAPAGYRTYRWLVDGKNSGSGDTINCHWQSPGEYKVECVATDPVGNKQPYYRVEYQVTVR